MVLQHDLIVAVLVIIAVVVILSRCPPNLLLGCFQAHEVDFTVIKQLCLLVVCDETRLRVHFESLSDLHREDWFLDYLRRFGFRGLIELFHFVFGVDAFGR